MNEDYFGHYREAYICKTLIWNVKVNSLTGRAEACCIGGGIFLSPE